MNDAARLVRAAHLIRKADALRSETIATMARRDAVSGWSDRKQQQRRRLRDRVQDLVAEELATAREASHLLGGDIHPSVSRKTPRQIEAIIDRCFTSPK